MATKGTLQTSMLDQLVVAQSTFGTDGKRAVCRVRSVYVVDDRPWYTLEVVSNADAQNRIETSFCTLSGKIFEYTGELQIAAR